MDRQEGKAMKHKYIVQLTDDQRQQLEKLSLRDSSCSRNPAGTNLAQVRQQQSAGPNWSYTRISETLDVSEVTIASARRACVTNWSRGSVAPQEAPSRVPSPPGWRRGSSPDCFGLQSTAGRPCALDAPAVTTEGHRIELCGDRFP
jgi:hypothetical protein